MSSTLKISALSQLGRIEKTSAEGENSIGEEEFAQGAAGLSGAGAAGYFSSESAPKITPQALEKAEEFERQTMNADTPDDFAAAYINRGSDIMGADVVETLGEGATAKETIKSLRESDAIERVFGDTGEYNKKHYESFESGPRGALNVMGEEAAEGNIPEPNRQFLGVDVDQINPFEETTAPEEREWNREIRKVHANEGLSTYLDEELQQVATENNLDLQNREEAERAVRETLQKDDPVINNFNRKVNDYWGNAVEDYKGMLFDKARTYENTRRLSGRAALGAGAVGAAGYGASKLYQHNVKEGSAEEDEMPAGTKATGAGAGLTIGGVGGVGGGFVAAERGNTLKAKLQAFDPEKWMGRATRMPAEDFREIVRAEGFDGSLDEVDRYAFNPNIDNTNDQAIDYKTVDWEGNQVARPIAMHELGHYKSMEENFDSKKDYKKTRGPDEPSVFDDIKNYGKRHPLYQEEVRAWDNAEEMMERHGEGMDAKDVAVRKRALDSYDQQIRGEQLRRLGRKGAKGGLGLTALGVGLSGLGAYQVHQSNNEKQANYPGHRPTQDDISMDNINLLIKSAGGPGSGKSRDSTETISDLEKSPLITIHKRKKITGHRSPDRNTDLSLDKIKYGAQTTYDIEKLGWMLTHFDEWKGESIQVARVGGEYHLMDGHHRYLAARRLNESSLPAEVWVMDENEVRQVTGQEKEGEEFEPDQTGPAKSASVLSQLGMDKEAIRGRFFQLPDFADIKKTLGGPLGSAGKSVDETADAAEGAANASENAADAAESASDSTTIDIGDVNGTKNSTDEGFSGKLLAGLTGGGAAIGGGGYAATQSDMFGDGPKKEGEHVPVVAGQDYYSNLNDETVTVEGVGEETVEVSDGDATWTERPDAVREKIREDDWEKTGEMTTGDWANLGSGVIGGGLGVAGSLADNSKYTAPLMAGSALAFGVGPTYNAFSEDEESDSLPQLEEKEAASTKGERSLQSGFDDPYETGLYSHKQNENNQVGATLEGTGQAAVLGGGIGASSRSVTGESAVNSARRILKDGPSQIPENTADVLSDVRDYQQKANIPSAAKEIGEGVGSDDSASEMVQRGLKSLDVPMVSRNAMMGAAGGAAVATGANMLKNNLSYNIGRGASEIDSRMGDRLSEKTGCALSQLGQKEADEEKSSSAKKSSAEKSQLGFFGKEAYDVYHQEIAEEDPTKARETHSWTNRSPQRARGNVERTYDTFGEDTKVRYNFGRPGSGEMGVAKGTARSADAITPKVDPSRSAGPGTTGYLSATVPVQKHPDAKSLVADKREEELKSEKKLKQELSTLGGFTLGGLAGGAAGLALSPRNADEVAGFIGAGSGATLGTLAGRGLSPDPSDVDVSEEEVNVDEYVEKHSSKKTAAEPVSNYAQDAAAGIDPFGAFTSRYATGNQKAGLSEANHRGRQAVNAMGGVIGGGLAVPSVIGGIDEAMSGARRGSGVAGRLAGAASGLVEGVQKPVRGLIDSGRARNAIDRSLREGGTKLDDTEVDSFNSIKEEVTLDSVNSTGLGGSDVGPEDVARFQQEDYLTENMSETLDQPVTEATSSLRNNLGTGAVIGGGGAAWQYENGRNSAKEYGNTEQRSSAEVVPGGEKIDEMFGADVKKEAAGGVPGPVLSGGVGALGGVGANALSQKANMYRGNQERFNPYSATLSGLAGAGVGAGGSTVARRADEFLQEGHKTMSRAQDAAESVEDTGNVVQDTGKAVQETADDISETAEKAQDAADEAEGAAKAKRQAAEQARDNAMFGVLSTGTDDAGDAATSSSSSVSESADPNANRAPEAMDPNAALRNMYGPRNVKEGSARSTVGDAFIDWARKTDSGSPEEFRKFLSDNTDVSNPDVRVRPTKEDTPMNNVKFDGGGNGPEMFEVRSDGGEYILPGVKGEKANELQYHNRVGNVADAEDTRRLRSVEPIPKSRTVSDGPTQTEFRLPIGDERVPKNPDRTEEANALLAGGVMGGAGYVGNRKRQGKPVIPKSISEKNPFSGTDKNAENSDTITVEADALGDMEHGFDLDFGLRGQEMNFDFSMPDEVSLDPPTAEKPSAGRATAGQGPDPKQVDTPTPDAPEPEVKKPKQMVD